MSRAMYVCLYVPVCTYFHESGYMTVSVCMNLYAGMRSSYRCMGDAVECVDAWLCMYEQVCAYVCMTMDGCTPVCMYV